MAVSVYSSHEKGAPVAVVEPRHVGVKRCKPLWRISFEQDKAKSDSNCLVPNPGPAAELRKNPGHRMVW